MDIGVSPKERSLLIIHLTFTSKGGPTAGRLINCLESNFAVYEAEPGVFDVYVDAADPVMVALEGVSPAWRMHLDCEAVEAGWANQVGTVRQAARVN